MTVPHQQGVMVAMRPEVATSILDRVAELLEELDALDGTYDEVQRWTWLWGALAGEAVNASFPQDWSEVGWPPELFANAFEMKRKGRIMTGMKAEVDALVDEWAASGAERTEALRLTAMSVLERDLREVASATAILLRDEVKRARARGDSWSAIGSMLDVSPQATHRRFGP